MRPILEQIKNLTQRIGHIRDSASLEHRELRPDEADEIDDLLDEISGLEARGRSQKDRPLTVPYGDDFHDLGTTRGNNMKETKNIFGSFGEQLLAVRNAGSVGGATDPRLFEVRAATGLSESVPSDGGFLVESSWSNQLLQDVEESGEILKRCQKMTINTPSIKLPAEDQSSRATGSRHGGVRAYWLSEASEKTASTPKFKQLEYNVQKVVVLIYATDELLDDAKALESYIRRVAVDEIKFAVEDSVINGTGAGQPLGILNSGALITQGKETGQAADTIVLENLIGMYSRMAGRYRKNGVWLINQDIEPQLYQLSLAVGTGGSPIFLPGGNASTSPYSTLLGRPLIPVEYASTLGDAGDIILADLSQYMIVDRGAPKADVSIHVSFLYDQSVFRFVYRVAGGPLQSAPVTQYKGAQTLSPFVTLIARA